MLVEGNTIYSLRQPGYVNASSGIIRNNTVSLTKGWVIADADLQFVGNQWGVGDDANVYDVAIISATRAAYYTDIVTISKDNNDAVIEDQRPTTGAVLSVVHVDAAAAAGGTGGVREPYKKISDADARVVAKGKILVAAGTYAEDVAITKQGVRLLGAGMNKTTIIGPKTGSNTTLVIKKSDVLVDGFTITRDGNNPTDWATNVKENGVQVKRVTTSELITGVVIQNCTITANRNGIDVYASPRTTIKNNIITNNRTGIHFNSSVDGTVVEQNEITNNWTAGILFNKNDDTNTESINIHNNIITGNWYGEIQARWNMKAVMDVSGNYFGKVGITRSTINSTEPKYVEQIPVEFGGTATNPGNAATIGGASIAVLDYSPFLATGVDGDTSKEGFQGDLSQLAVDDESASVTGVSPVQEAIDTTSAGGKIYVLPGSYTEKAANSKIYKGDLYQFGLFFGQDKPGLTVQGVDAAGAPITAVAKVAARIVTDATNNFGPSGIFVEANQVTIEGLEIGNNVTGQNKTIEVIGDQFALRNSFVNDPDGSIYFNDWRFDDKVTPNVSYVQAYALEGNRLAAGVSVDLASGAGFSGPVSGRVIRNNIFDASPAASWPAVSFSGSGTGVEWFTYSVGGALISGNQFGVRGTQYIRARGDYDLTQFDWPGYLAGNTFDQTVVVYTPAGEFSEYTYTSGKYVFNHVRQIGATVQGGIDVAQPGERVQLSAGTFTEQVEITKAVTVAGTGDSSIIQSPVTMTKSFTTSSAHKPVVYVHDTDQVTIRSLMVDGAGRGNTNYRMDGIAYYKAGGLVEAVTVENITDTPFSGSQHGNGVFAYANDGDARNFTIQNSTVRKFQKTGIVVSGAKLTGTVSGNTVTGAGPSTVIAQNGIQLNTGASGTILNNKVSGFSYTPTSYTSVGILVMQAGPAVIQGNTVTDGEVGIYMIDTSGAISQNYVSASKAGVGANYWGIVVTDPPAAKPSPFDDGAALIVQPQGSVGIMALPKTTISVTENEITGGGASDADSVGLEADAGYDADVNIDFTAAKNLIKGWQYGIAATQCSGASCKTGTFAALELSNNSITECQTAFDNASGFTSAAALNWWGSATGPKHAANPGGVGLAVSDDISYNPWLCAGTDTSTDVGFQPAADTAKCTAAPTRLVFDPDLGEDWFVGQPQQVTVKAVDQDGNVAINFAKNVQVTLGDNPAGSSLGGTNVLAASNGVAVFTGLTIDKVGSAFKMKADAEVFNGSSLNWGFSGSFDVLATEADLAVEQDEVLNVNPYADFTYRITVSNAGPWVGKTIKVTDSLPAAVTYLGYNAPGWTCSFANQEVVCQASSLASGSSSVIEVSIRAPFTSEGAVLVNQITVSSGVTDPVADNNTITRQTVVITAQPLAPYRLLLPVVGK